VYPFRRNNLAVSLPIPEDAPVIKTVLLIKLIFKFMRQSSQLKKEQKCSKYGL
jgi:hypothetical protein